MNLLNHLLEFSQAQTFMSFSDSPTAPYQISTQLHQFSSAVKRVEEVSLQKRPASKSVSKMTLFSHTSNNTSTINPRQRLLHRMVHKINMKCRKHYYQFFVLLQNFKPAPKISTTDEKRINEENLRNSILKLQQINQILFYKYFQQPLKKHSFLTLKNTAKCRAVARIVRLFDKKLRKKGFMSIIGYNKSIQKDEIRLDILLSSIQNIQSSIKQQNLTFSLKAIARTSQKHKQRPVEKLIEKSISKPMKKPMERPRQLIQKLIPIPQHKIQAKISGETLPTSINKPRQPERKEMIDEMSQETRFSQQYKKYKQLKQMRQSRNSSPLKCHQPLQIRLTCSMALGVESKFGKALTVKTNLKQSCFDRQISDEERVIQLYKKIEIDTINCKQIHDINNKSIFLDFLFDKKEQITESNVIQYHSRKLYTESSHSQLTLIDHFSEVSSEQHKGSLKCSRFGTEAVNFKNSLIYERQTLNSHQLEPSNHTSKEPTFHKPPKITKNEYSKLSLPSALPKHIENSYYPEKDYSSINLIERNSQEKRNSQRKRYNLQEDTRSQQKAFPLDQDNAITYTSRNRASFRKQKEVNGKEQKYSNLVGKLQQRKRSLDEGQFKYPQTTLLKISRR